MASATTRPSFTFNLSTTTSLSQPSLPRIKSHLTFPHIPSKIQCISALQSHTKSHVSLAVRSIDVSKEDKPVSSEEEAAAAKNSAETTATTTDDDDQSQEEATKFDKKRLEEKFVVLNTGIYECRSCGYRYDEAVGDSSYPIPPGLPFAKLPGDWRCPTCGASQTFFQSKSVEIAGFAENQQFGLGGNTLTSGQKALLIWGGLGLGFLFFLSGYFLE